MTSTFSVQTHRTARLVAQLFACIALTTVSSLVSAAADPDQSRLVPPPGDGWQMLSAPVARSASVALAMATPQSAPTAAPTPLAESATPSVVRGSSTPVPSSLAVATVVAPSAGAAVSSGVLTLSITPQDINLRNALDRWLQQQGWQLAWKIDDDLPLEFNASFSGDFKSVLTQVMQATNHMRTPTRICKHTNNVIRVVARAANCQE
ncbi:toxin co-regulated pilus biosynthesis Q family protein [Caballeronia glathei]|uniref:toxin co-regulated pilus biosynthesis Q family protein n=1 Tax=Caballeronia glathei TaxID=60547 RepID=UPI000569EE1E|nr:toxin co-regulated pilus biosynthesis Q family protein [Caballeronia glathei]